MIDPGRLATCTLPSAALTVTGKPPAAAAFAVPAAVPPGAVLPQTVTVTRPRTVTAARARGRRVRTRMMIILPDRGGRSAPLRYRGASSKPPFLRGQCPD